MLTTPTNLAAAIKVSGQNPPEKLPPFSSNIQPQPKPQLPPLPPEKRVGFAVIGLGRLSVEEIIPAFGECKLSKLVAVMTGDKEKGKRIASYYGLKESSVYGYSDWDKLKNNQDIDVVYIVTPNGLHKDMVIEAAGIGKNILCEKPMANSSEEAQLMIDACIKAKVKLMIAYRCQYEPHHEAVLEIVKRGELGKLRSIEAYNGQVQDYVDQWRHNLKLAGGGALPDVGIYCLNFARVMSQEEPIEVSAWAWSPADDMRFKEIEANVNWQMRFPSGIYALLGTSYDSYQSRTARLHFEKGTIEMSPAFSYEGIRFKVIHKDSKKEDVNLVTEHILGEKNQFALEMDHMSECVLNNTQPKTSGEEGLKDQRVIEAIYQSAKDNKPVKIS